MKGKLIGLFVALAAIATVGVANLPAQAATPGKVGNAPRCTVVADGARATAFRISGTTATVGFKVSGPANCRVQLSANSFYAPSINGRPYNQQVLFNRATKVYKPGHYTTAVKLPATSTKAKGCFYQVDLTYGTHNVTPVIAYGHGKLPCGTPPAPKPPAPKPPVPPKLVPGVSINKLVDGVDYKKVEKNVEFTYQIAVKNTGQTDLQNVIVKDTPQAGVTLLSASAGSVASNTWTYTIPSLAKGASANFTIKAKVPVYKAGAIKNTVCVDAPSVPGTPDDCDDATVEVPEPGKVPVCDPETGKTIEVSEEEVDEYLPVNDPKCKPVVKPVEVCDPETGTTIAVPEDQKDDYLPVNDEACQETPEEEPVEEIGEIEEIPVTELPETGPMNGFIQLLGLGSIVGSGGSYLISRKLLLAEWLKK